MNKIKVHYICRRIGNPINDEKWGGTMATNYSIKKCFEKSDKYELMLKTKREFKSIEDMKKFLDEGDISWLDEDRILEEFYSKGYNRPKVIGPITRSSIKDYGGARGDVVYTPDWFYNGVVLRNNENEEVATRRPEFKNDGVDYLKKVNLIRNGVDTELLQPNNKSRKYVLWAGDKDRPAKNYPFWGDVKNEIKQMGGLPDGFEIKEMSGYKVKEFWEVLDETAVYVLTSHYESFCNAANEARSKGIPTIVRDFLTGQYMYTDQPIQVPYTPQDFAKKIIELLNNKKLLEDESNKARDWVLGNCSLEIMRKDIEKVFDKIEVNKNE